MPPEANPGATPGTDATSGQPGQQQNQQPASGQQQGTPPATGNHGDPAMDAMMSDAGREALRSEREARAALDKELRELRPRLAAFEKAEKDRTDAELSDTQRRDRTISEQETKIADLELENQQLKLGGEVAAKAAALGFRNPAVAHKLLDVSAIEYDSSGKAKNIDALLKKVLEDDPYLAATGDFGGGNRGSTPTTTDMNALLRRGR